MTYPKNRKIIYTVVRTQEEIVDDKHDGHITNWVNPVVLDSFRTLERAEEVLGQYLQKYHEANIHMFSLEIQTSSYYDE